MIRYVVSLNLESALADSQCPVEVTEAARAELAVLHPPAPLATFLSSPSMELTGPLLREFDDQLASLSGLTPATRDEVAALRSACGRAIREHFSLCTY